MATTKTLVWRGPADGAACKPNVQEGICIDAGVLPGTLMEVVATGLQESTIAATAFDSQPMLANRDSMRQKNMDEVWIQNDTMQAVEFRSGEFGTARVALGQNITARRTALSSNGDGTLKIAVTDGTEQILFYSDEIINTGAAIALVTVYKG